MHLSAWVVAVLIAWLLIAEPLLGRRAHRQLMQALDAGEPGARRRFYLQWTWQGWLLVAVTALVAFGLVGWTPSALGLGLPRDGGAIPVEMLLLVSGAMLSGAFIGAIAARLSPRKATDHRPSVAGGNAVLRMLPRCRSDRWAFAALAITAGIGEEFVWRGFGLAALQLMWPQAQAHVAATVLLLALPFGWAHFYQGLAGVLGTAAIGAVMAGLYVASGSLLIPALLHVLIDLRALLLPVPADPVAPSVFSSGTMDAGLSSGGPRVATLGEESHERDA